VREDFGLFLGVDLQQRGFHPAATGFALSLAGLAGLVTQDLGFAASCVASASVAATGSAMWMVGRRALGLPSLLRQSSPASAEPV
jgi:hypothetical protein